MTQRLVFDDRERVARWACGGDDPTERYGSYYAMGAERDGELVSAIVVDHLNGSNALAHITIKKPGKDTHALIRAFCDYAFNQLKLKRITGFVPSTWTNVLEFDKKIGFEEEFVVKDGYTGGDMVMLVMRPETCKWLDKVGATI